MSSAPNGFVRLDRGFFDHWIWSEKRVYSRAEAWLDLIAMCAYEPHKRMIAGELVEVPRGAVVASERFLSTRWDWSRTKVRTFLKVLTDDGMVKIEAGKKDQQNTIISLCNFEKHNPKKDQQKTTEEPVKNQQRTTEEPLKDQIKEREEGKDVQEGKDVKNNTAPQAAGGFSLDSEPKEAKPKKERFTPPTFQEAKEYAKEIGLTDAESAYIYDWYETKGWVVGKLQMKSWKAAWRTAKLGWDFGKVNAAALEASQTPTKEQMAEWTQNRIDREREREERAAAKARGETWEEKSDF